MVRVHNKVKSAVHSKLGIKNKVRDAVHAKLVPIKKTTKVVVVPKIIKKNK